MEGKRGVRKFGILGVLNSKPVIGALSHSDGIDISVLKDENSKMKQSLCLLGAREWC